MCTPQLVGTGSSSIRSVERCVTPGPSDDSATATGPPHTDACQLQSDHKKQRSLQCAISNAGFPTLFADLSDESRILQATARYAPSQGGCRHATGRSPRR
jgi:hypothetical protein